MVNFEIKLTEQILENLKKICGQNDIFIELFLIKENYKNFNSSLIDDLEDFVRKNYTDKVKIKNCVSDLQNFHNILCEIAKSTENYKKFMIIKKLNTKNEMNELNFSYNYDKLYIK